MDKICEKIDFARGRERRRDAHLAIWERICRRVRENRIENAVAAARVWEGGGVEAVVSMKTLQIDGLGPYISPQSIFF
jgi:hypothetical protein